MPCRAVTHVKAAITMYAIAIAALLQVSVRAVDP